MKNSHQCIYHLIFKGQECTAPNVIVKKKTVNYREALFHWKFLSSFLLILTQI